MRRLLLVLAACLALPGLCPAAAEKLYLSRTIQIDFDPPGKITRVGASGATPVAEEMHPNSFVLILPPRINLRLSIALDNIESRRRFINVNILNEKAPTQKVEGWVKPTDLTKTFWLDTYRFQLTLVNKDGDTRGFVKATVQIDVYAPEAKKP